MYSSLSYSLSGERPSDRSRFWISYSEANFRPAPSDLAIDQALEDFAALSLQSTTRPSRRSIAGGSQYTSYRAPNLNPQSTAYLVSYAGSNTSASTVTCQQPLKMIGYPGPGSTVSIRSRRTRQGPIDQYRYAQPTTGSNYNGESKALTQYSHKGKRSRDPFSEVMPEDSISQVSMSSRRSDFRDIDLTERRGRTRRREEERSTVVGRSDGRREGQDADEQCGGQGYGGAPAYYETREVTPWD